MTEMTDTVLVIIVGAVSGTISGITGIVMMFVKYRLDRAEKKWALEMETAKEARAHQLAAVTGAREAIDRQSENINKIEKQGNSIQTAMVELTKAAALAEGIKQGIAEEKAAQAIRALAKEDRRESAAEQSQQQPVVPVAIVSLPEEKDAT